jgi:geranylgeranyl pyrophosphate synthase
LNTVSQLEEQPKRRTRRRKTSHLKLVPESRELREAIKAQCDEIASHLPKTRPLSKDEMEKIARSLLEQLKLPEGYLGWTMVLLSSAFWKDQVAAVPPSRRLFLLPHCLKHAQGCPADYDQFGLDCKTCGACSIADFRSAAEDMGYKVLVAEGSPIVLKIIISGYVDAIVGVACLNVLEKAIDKILLAGIPCMAVPLLSSDCRNTSVDEDWVRDMVYVKHEQPKHTTQSYLHLMRASAGMFAAEELQRLVPKQRDAKSLAEANGSGIGAFDPIAATEAIAYDFLSRGGKHSRPFITLATYDALTDGKLTTDPSAIDQIPDAVRRAAMSIETFHKASLVHDDIQDDDQFRYGAESIHRKYGIPTAINVGDYLIGMGYRLVSRESKQLGAEVVVDILDCLADAHLRLSEGQGAELLWRDASNKRLQPIDALKIYALKTSPAFEAAFYTGMRLAGAAEDYVKPLKQFSRNLGVAFQILNDLGDWQGDRSNKLVAGGDILGGRPTLLWALALAGLSGEQQQELMDVVADRDRPDDERIARVRELYEIANVFEQASRLVDKHQAKAEEIADEIQPEGLRRLFYYLIDTVLQRPTEEVKPTIQIIETMTINDLAALTKSGSSQ